MEKTFIEVFEAEMLAEVELRARRNHGLFAQQPGGTIKRFSGRIGGDKKPVDCGEWEWNLSARRHHLRHAEPIPAPSEALAEAKELSQATPTPGRLLAAYCDGSKVVLTEATPFGKRRSVIQTEARFFVAVA